MICNEALERIRLVADEVCSSFGGMAEVSAHGPMSASILLPNGVEDVEAVAQDIADRLDGLATDYVQLSQWYLMNDEDWTEDEERTILMDVMKDACEFSDEEIAAHRKENIIEIDPRWKNGSEIAFMPINRMNFNAIMRGEKKFEWRDYKKTWVQRVIAPKAKFVKFQGGYTKDAPTMIWSIKDVRLADSDEEGGERYSPYDIPPMAEPQYIVIELGERVL